MEHIPVIDPESGLCIGVFNIIPQPNVAVRLAFYNPWNWNPMAPPTMDQSESPPTAPTDPPPSLPTAQNVRLPAPPEPCTCRPGTCIRDIAEQMGHLTVSSPSAPSEIPQPPSSREIPPRRTSPTRWFYTNPWESPAPGGFGPEPEPEAGYSGDPFSYYPEYQSGYYEGQPESMEPQPGYSGGQPGNHQGQGEYAEPQAGYSGAETQYVEPLPGYSGTNVRNFKGAEDDGQESYMVAKAKYWEAKRKGDDSPTPEYEFYWAKEGKDKNKDEENSDNHRPSKGPCSGGGNGKRRGGKNCPFCRSNREPRFVCRTHNLRDDSGNIICPVLRSLVCPICGASGANAHTLRYCPQNIPGHMVAGRLAEEEEKAKEKKEDK